MLSIERGDTNDKPLSLTSNNNETRGGQRQEAEERHFKTSSTEKNMMVGKIEPSFAPRAVQDHNDLANEDAIHLEMKPRNMHSFHQAVTSGLPSGVRLFLLEEKHRINELDTEHGLTALHLASRHNRTEVVNLLLDFGANIDIKGADGFTALHLASRLVYSCPLRYCGHI